MTHFLLSLVVLAGAIVVALEAVGAGRASGAARLEPRCARHRRSRRAALALVVSGTVATAAGPHSGDSDEGATGSGRCTRRVYVHVRATAVFGSRFLFLLGYLFARRGGAPLPVPRGARRCSALLLVQMALGEIQYRTHLPWWLVLVHVAVAGAVWAGERGLRHAAVAAAAAAFAAVHVDWPMAASCMSRAARRSSGRC